MGFSLKKIFKPVKKAGQWLVKANKEVAADAFRIAGGYFGAPGIGNRLGDAIEPGDTAATNAQKRADFEYARSLADQYAFQNDSVQRRVADARAAGIHPLAALGFQSPSFVPPQTSGYYEGSQNEMAELGQDIGRAVYAAQTEKERKATLATQAVIDGLSVQRLGLENRNLEAEIEYKRLRTLQLLRGQSPAFPDVNAIRNVGVQELGQGDVGKYAPMTTTYRAPDGTLVTVLSEQYNESTEGDPVGRTRGLYETYYKPWREQTLIAAEKFKLDLYDYYGRRLRPVKATGKYKTMRRPYRVPNRVRGSRISSYHTQ